MAMSEAASARSLLLRLREPEDRAPAKYPVEVTLDGAGTFNATVSIPLDALAALESNPWDYGRQLGQAVFAESGLQRALAYARAGNEPVSVHLQIDARSLNDLRWERMILVVGAEEVVFAASTQVALSRRIPSEIVIPPPRRGPFRLLLCVASPLELEEAGPDGPRPPIDLERELEALREAWDPLVLRGLLRVSVLGRVPDALAHALRNHGYRVEARAATLDALGDQLSSSDSLHLIAHGAFRTGQASLLLENEAGRAALASEEALLSRIGERSLRLIFLQACQSAARSRGDADVMSGLAPKLTARAASVVAMQELVRVGDARRFAQEFYDTLLGTGYADRAVNAGRRALYRPDSSSWAIPILYLGPQADPVWQPDAVLSGVQALAEQFRKKPEFVAPFPIEVIRQWPGVSSKMETSPPGPRTRVLDAVTSALFAPDGVRTPIVVLAGNYGRAKTAQLLALYVHFASRAAHDEPLPLFARISEFHALDEAPETIVTQAIVRSYKQFGIDLPFALIRDRLQQPCVLCVDSDAEADSRRRIVAFESLRQLTDSFSTATAIVTLDEQVIDQIPALNDDERRVPVLIVQLLSPATVAQYLTGLGEKCQGLLEAIQRANLFDLAGVPWLLAHLMRQPPRSSLSRSAVIARVVNGNLAAANLPPGVRRVVHDLLGQIAWTLQVRQDTHLDGAALDEHLERVRGRREIGLEQLKAHALDTRILTTSDEDGVRFSYPGFQSHWCAQHLLDGERTFSARLNDITATLGRRSRVRLWEDTLVLLAGLMTQPDRLIGRFLAGSSLSYGEHAFLAARCIHEAKLAGRAVSDNAVEQVLDSLIWRSTPTLESRSAIRIRAVESIALLNHPASIPHLIALAIGHVRPSFTGSPTFELSGTRHAALQALLTMEKGHEEAVSAHPSASTGSLPALRALIDAWRAGDSTRLRALYASTDVEGLPAVIAFALGTIGGPDNLEFLSEQITRPDVSIDTSWSLADSLLLFTPADVSGRAIARMRPVPGRCAQAAYMIGKLRVADSVGEDTRFLVGLLHGPSVRTRGVALRALAQLGDVRLLRDCELIAEEAWEQVAQRGAISVPEDPGDRLTLRIYAIESLRLIGTRASLPALRSIKRRQTEQAIGTRNSNHLVQLSYEVSEDIYWRETGGLEGDFFDPLDSDASPD